MDRNTFDCEALQKKLDYGLQATEKKERIESCESMRFMQNLSKMIDCINSFYENFDVMEEMIESEKIEKLEEIMLEISNNCLIEIGRYYKERIGKED